MDLETQLLEAARQRRLADLLRGEAEKTDYTELPGRMVSNRYVAPSWTQSLSNAIAPILAMSRAKEAESRATASEGAARAAQLADYQDWISQRPQATQQPIMGEQAGPLQPGEAPLSQVQVGSRTVEPSQQQNLAWAARGQANPLSKALANQYASDLIIKAPEREAEREIKQAHLVEQAKFWQGQLKNASNAIDQKYAANALQQTIAEMNLTGKRERNATDIQIASMRSDSQAASDASHERIADVRAQRALERVRENHSKMTAKQLSELDEADKANSDIDSAISGLQSVKEGKVESFIRGAITEAAPGSSGAVLGNLGRDDKIKAAREMAFNIADGIRKERFGTALSKYEKASAGQYMPTGYEDPTELVRKLQGLKNLMATGHKRLRLMESGYSAEEAMNMVPSGSNETTTKAAPPIPSGSVTTPPAKKLSKAEPGATYTPGAAKTLLGPNVEFLGTDGNTYRTPGE